MIEELEQDDGKRPLSHEELTDIIDLCLWSGQMLLQTAVYAIRTGLILAGLAFGIIAPNLLFRRQRPVI